MGILDKFKSKKVAVKAISDDVKDIVVKKKKRVKDEAVIKPPFSKSVISNTIKTAKKDNIAYKVIMKPLVSEKTTELANQGKYVFSVNKNSNKIEIAKAVEGLYGVNVQKVNVIKTIGKIVNFGKTVGKRNTMKKAIVTLKNGQTIEVFEGV